MEIAHRLIGGLVILDLKGSLVVSPGEGEVPPLRDAIAQLIAVGRVNVAFHLARLAHIDARGLGELVYVLTTLRAHGGRLVLISPSPVVKRLLSVTKLDTVFAVYDSELEAVPYRPVLSSA